MFPFIVGGFAIIGGVLVLLLKKDDDTASTDPTPNSKNKDRNPQVSNYDLDKVRQARRELRYQTRQKKKLTSTPKTDKTNDGEEE